MLVSSLGGYDFIDRFLALSKWQKFLVLFVLTLVLRWLMLTQTQVITHDIEMYVYRSEHMLEGELPYIDFSGGSKPPLYHFMLWGMGFLVSPGVVQFRAVFSVVDALIPVALFILCTEKYDERFASVAAFTYLLFPVGIICIGLSGHYDSVVAIFTMLSLFMLFREKAALSGLSLGVAFALKLYPIVLLPFFLSTLKRWRDRVLYTILFLLPSLISLGVLYLISPSAFFKYFEVQTGWVGCSAFSSTIEMMLNTTRIFSVKISWLVFFFFGFLNLLLLRDWLSEKRSQNLIKWFRYIIIIFIAYYGIYIIYGVLYYGYPLYMAALPLAIYCPVAALSIVKVLPRIVPDTLTDVEGEGLFIVSTYSIILFLFGLPNYAPWYFIWFFPFMLAIRTDKIRYALLWILPWHGIGRDMRLIPGSTKIN
jgi:hypothetical protein